MEGRKKEEISGVKIETLNSSRVRSEAAVSRRLKQIKKQRNKTEKERERMQREEPKSGDGAGDARLCVLQEQSRREGYPRLLLLGVPGENCHA